jgi:hypothetical protein
MSNSGFIAWRNSGTWQKIKLYQPANFLFFMPSRLQALICIKKAPEGTFKA